MERRVTRAWARQTGEELQQGINQVQARTAVQWRQAVVEGPPFVCDKYGLPVGSGGAQLQKKIAYKRKSLRRMSVTQRNQLLTGYPAFPFNPVAYNLTFNYPQNQEDFELYENLDSNGKLQIRIFPREETTTTIQSPLQERRSTPKIKKRNNRIQKCHKFSSHLRQWLIQGPHQNSGNIESSKRNFTHHLTHQWQLFYQEL